MNKYDCDIAYDGHLKDNSLASNFSNFPMKDERNIFDS